jgi:hypothetical protein
MPKASDGKNGSSTRTTRNRKPGTASSPAKGPVAVASAAFKAADHGDLEELIRQRAYELYEQEGRQDGRDQEYWLRAEAEVRGRRTA